MIEYIEVSKAGLDAFIEYADSLRRSTDSQFSAGLADDEESQREWDEKIAALYLLAEVPCAVCNRRDGKCEYASPGTFKVLVEQLGSVERAHQHGARALGQI